MFSISLEYNMFVFMKFSFKELIVFEIVSIISCVFVLKLSFMNRERWVVFVRSKEVRRVGIVE